MEPQAAISMVFPNPKKGELSNNLSSTCYSLSALGHARHGGELRREKTPLQETRLIGEGVAVASVHQFVLRGVLGAQG